MRKKPLLLCSALWISACGLFAQDMTPKNWKFSEMPLGSAESLFIPETCKTSWNISFPYRAGDSREGAITVSCYPSGDIVTAEKMYGELPASEQGVFDDLFSSCSIVPGGPLGNLFCIKGKNTTASDGRGVTNSYSMPMSTFWFVSGNDLPLNSAYRISFSLRTIVNSDLVGAALKLTVGTSHWDGIDAGSYRQIEAAAYPDFNDYWTTYAFDIQLDKNSDASYKVLPFVIKAYFEGGLLDNGMTLIKDIKVEKINAVDPAYSNPCKVIEEDWTDSNETGITSVSGKKEALVWNAEQELTVVDARSDIELYNISGQLAGRYQSKGALTTIELPAKGIYMVKVDGLTKKIVW